MTIRKGGALNSTLRVLSLLDEQGGRIALACFWACHPENLWEFNTRVSADFVGDFRRALTKSTGAPAVYFNGALGGMVTGALDEYVSLEEREAFIDWLGRDLALQAASALPAPEAHGEFEIAARRSAVELEITNKRFLLGRRLGIFKRARFHGNRLETEVNLLRIGDAA